MPSANRRTRPAKNGRRPRPAFPVGRLVEPPKSIEQLAAEQGIDPTTQLQKVLGSGESLWKSDAELDRFLQDIYERRRQDRI